MPGWTTTICWTRHRCAETGIQRREDGTLLVAVRTDLHGCKGRMLDWWFTFFETTQHIRWWHPVDHVEHRGWDAAWQRGRSYHGASIHAVESLADIRRWRHA